MSSDKFEPEKYRDEYRLRVLAMVDAKLKAAKSSPCSSPARRGRSSTSWRLAQIAQKSRGAGEQHAVEIFGCDLLPFEYCPPRRPGINSAKLAGPFERTLRFLPRSKPSCYLLLNADALLEEAVAGQILNSPLENGQPQLDFGRRLSGRVNQIEGDHAT